MTIDARKERFELVEVLGHPMLFTCLRVDRSTVPKGLGLLALYGVISLVRSVLEPKIMAAQVDLSPLAALAAMYVGFCAFGVAGMVLCPMALLFVKQLHDSGWLRLWK